ncbi:TPA: hypothetical protein N0F65_009709 [Lagenidium giganteum]|uniref:Calmodulin n=1 Tax=Lagenidium giganteum TaxID=4803 RepID=A0AAV2YIM6_9STRA|nr:TPA: hypothetical protein N0F65_009709 [Lagenidium giganteum]
MELPVRSADSCKKRLSKNVFHLGERLSFTDMRKKSPSSGSAGTPRHMTLPHTITERHGGKELWVKAPVLSDVMEKQGFRWRKKWKLRFIELNGRVLSYYDVKDQKQPNAKPRMKIHITADAVLEDIDEHTFALTPDEYEKPWVFRTKDARTKLKWCTALSDCIDILTWLQHYQVGDVLGVGGNGVVKQLSDKRTGQRFAVKVVDASKFKNREAVVQEVEILRNITNNIKHPHLVQIHKVYEEHEKIYVILQLCSGGELYDRIVQRGKYSEADAANIMKQLMSALHALHEHNILHLDIKPENILFDTADDDAKIILTDFGLARMVNGTKNPLQEGQSMAGTIGYIAPEVITSHIYSPAADVFSAGVILFILLVGYPPFYGDTEVEILLKIARGDYQFHPDDWAHVSDNAKDLVTRMLTVRAQDRITIPEIMAHPWIVGKDDESQHKQELSRTIERMKTFNFDRKSENMGTWISTMMLDANDADHLALMDKQTIDMMIRRLTPSGRVPVERAHVLARALGVSPYVNERCFVEFLDQNHDGWIDAEDFCLGVDAIRHSNVSYTKIIFRALLRMISDESTVLKRAHFQVAFEKVKCPEPLMKVFFKHFDKKEHRDSLSDNTSSDSGHSATQGVDRVSSGGLSSIDYDWSISEEEFVNLIPQFPFVGALFLQNAKNKMVSIVNGDEQHITDDLHRITEDTRPRRSSSSSSTTSSLQQK